MTRRNLLGFATPLVIVATTLLPIASATGGAAAASSPSLTTTIGDFESADEGWSFYPGSEYPGATGGFTLDTSTAASGEQSGKLVGDFTGGGAYVAVSRDFAPIDVTALDFEAKTSDLSWMTLRLTDSTGQVHQQRLALSGSAEWQELHVTDFAGGDQATSWGGAADGAWHGPAKSIMFIVDRGAVANGSTTGTLWLDGVTLSYPAPPISLAEVSVGNVFTADETPAVKVTTAGDTLAWTATDSGGAVVASGTHAVTAVQGTLDLPIDRLGWFSVSVTASRDGVAIGTATTTLARLQNPVSAPAGGTPFGVSAHYGFTGVSTASIPLLAKAGVTNERDEMLWQSVEATKGTYVFPSDAYAQTLTQNGVAPLIILDYGNPNYDNGAAPTSPAAIAAFADYADALVGHYGGKISSFEIWNEWNGGAGTSPKTPQSYLALQKAVYEKVKTDHPEVTLVTPALALNDMQWLEQWMQLGGLQYTDAVSLHPYFYPQPPELLTAQLTQVKSLIAENNGGKAKPIWITEQGWPTGTAVQANSESDQASDLVRSALLALQGGVVRFFNYDFVDDGTDPGNLEHNFGLLHNAADPLGAYTPKPAYAAYASLTHQLTGATYVRSDQVGDGIYSLVFDRSGTTVRGLWSTSPTQVTLHTRQSVSVSDLYGNTQTYSPDPSGGIELTLGGEPIYVSGSISSIAAGGGSSLTVTSAFVGDPLAIDWTVDNSAERAPEKLSFEVGGTQYSLEVPGGKSATLPITLAAPSRTGSLSIVGDILRNGKRVGRLRVDAKVQTALQLQAKHVIDSGGAQQLEFVVSNASPVDNPVGALNWTLGSQSGTALAGASVPGGGQRAVDVPYDSAADEAYTGTLVLSGQPSLTVSGTLVPVAVSSLAQVPERTITVNGQLPDLSGLTPIGLPDDGSIVDGSYGGASDLSGSIWFTHDDQNLYLTAQITDDSQFQDQTAGNVWQGDSIQFSVGSGAPGEQTSWSEIGAALTPDGPQLYRWLATGGDVAGAIEGAQVAITRDDATHHTVYEVAIPWSRLQPIAPSDGLISLSLLVNDNDGAGRKGWVEWGGGIGDAKNSAEFKAARLLE